MLRPLSATRRASGMIVEDLEVFQSILPSRGALLALDFGLKRVGIAASTNDRSLAFALSVLERGNLRTDFSFLCELFSDRCAVAWVLGLPLSQTGKESAMSVETRRFATRLVAGQKPQAPLLLFDERFTSSIVERARRDENETRRGGVTRVNKVKKKAIDSAAATLLLQNCLDALANCVCKE